MPEKFRLRWGIIGPGEIARAFGRDILLNPETRGVTTLEHIIVAAASSSSLDRAKAFLEAVGAGPSAKAYSSYAELVEDPEVDIVYIASPHSHHFQHSMLCLNADKNVLCEKPITVNAAQLKKLMFTAKERRLFLMEGAWTRYMPASLYVQEAVVTGKIGSVHRVYADLSSQVPPDTVSDDHRLLDPNSAGGTLLDIGVYALTWAFMALKNRTTQHNEVFNRPILEGSALTKYRTGVDAQTSLIIRFPRSNSMDGHAVVTTSMLVPTQPPGADQWPSVRIQGSEGEIQVLHPIYRPEKTRLILSSGVAEEREWTQPGPGPGSGWKNGFQNQFGGGFHAEGVGHGLFWEADECAFALQGGRLESRIHPLEESLTMMSLIDEVRTKHGIEYPEHVETTSCPSST